MANVYVCFLGFAVAALSFFLFEAFPRGALIDLLTISVGIIDHGCTRRAFEDAKRLYDGAKLAGLTG